jgi:hypothetical protein
MHSISMHDFHTEARDAAVLHQAVDSNLGALQPLTQQIGCMFCGISFWGEKQYI